MWRKRAVTIATAVCFVGSLRVAAAPLTPDGLELDFRMTYYDVVGSNWGQVAAAIFANRPTIKETHERFEGITHSDMRLDETAGCAPDTAKVKVSLIVDVPQLARSSQLSGDDQACWAHYDRSITDHEELHVQIAVHDAQETLAAIRSSRNATCGDLRRLVAERLAEMRQEQVNYDAASEHGRVQWRAWGNNRDPDPERGALEASCAQRARAQQVAQ
jgi:predicted secreted Zn-dependent protease